mmetsp:Transcript_30295/g.93477  ORF Transcript_30295/g.93477 Transcript_30295/m.93477 type:complete len:204 (-) Transcript_30295:1566-2177(-)
MRVRGCMPGRDARRRPVVCVRCDAQLRAEPKRGHTGNNDGTRAIRTTQRESAHRWRGWRRSLGWRSGVVVPVCRAKPALGGVVCVFDGPCAADEAVGHDSRRSRRQRHTRTANQPPPHVLLADSVPSVCHGWCLRGPIRRCPRRHRAQYLLRRLRSARGQRAKHHALQRIHRAILDQHSRTAGRRTCRRHAARRADVPSVPSE